MKKEKSLNECHYNSRSILFNSLYSSISTRNLKINITNNANLINTILNILFTIILLNFVSLGHCQIQLKSELYKNIRALEEDTSQSSIYSTCGEKFCSTDNGKCISQSKSICECTDYFTTYPNDSIYLCTYQRKDQLIAFCLELFLMCGFGHFYIGNYYLGFPKLLLFIIGIVLIVFLRYYNRDKEDDNPVSLGIALAGCIVFCLMISWELFDIILFLFNKYNDSNGISLYAFRVSA